MIERMKEKEEINRECMGGLDWKGLLWLGGGLHSILSGYGSPLWTSLHRHPS